MHTDITREQLLQYVAPCSIICYACAECKNGAIARHAQALDTYFDGFDALRGDEGVAQFMQTLKFLAYHLNTCGGCRSVPRSDACIKDCFIPECTKEHQVDFCGECGEFPCQKVQQSTIFNEKNIQKWISHNQYIKENGAMTFFQNFKDKSQYSHYKNND